VRKLVLLITSPAERSALQKPHILSSSPTLETFIMLALQLPAGSGDPASPEQLVDGQLRTDTLLMC